MTAFFAFMAAAFVTVVLMLPLGRLAASLHMVDAPSGRKVHHTPTPRVGGLAMATGTVVPLILLAPMQQQLAAFLIGVAIILLFGAWDDVKGLDYRLKFLGQIIAVLVVMLWGDVVIRNLPFTGLDPLPDILAFPLTAFVLVGVTNAVNLADGLDGLAGGITLLSVAVIALLAYPADDATLLAASAAVMGSIVGFLRFNTYPARIFMGDGGSQFLGFSAGVLVIILTQQVNTGLSPALPLLLLGLPILDTVKVIAERVFHGRSPFEADMNHIHHKLLAIGFDHYEAVFVLYLLQALLVAAAYLLRFESDALIISVYAAYCIALVGVLWAAAASGWRVRRWRPGGREPRIRRWMQWLREDQRILKASFYFGAIAIACYFFLGAFLVESVPRDIGVLALVLLVVLAATFFARRHKPFSIVERGCAYIAGICIVYLIQVSPGALTDLGVYPSILFVAMAVAVAVGFRFSRDRFRVTPTDFLILFVALLVPSISELKSQLGMGVAMLVIVFYGIEFVLNNAARHWDMMRLTTCVTLAVVGFRGIAGALG